jgi:hypothetical protein
LDPEQACLRPFYRVKRPDELSQDPMFDRTDIFMPALRPAAALLGVAVLISCHKGAAAGSV